MRSLQPFGDVPQKLSQQLRQSFVATRTFNQALSNGKKILNKIVKVSWTPLKGEHCAEWTYRAVKGTGIFG